MNTRVLQTLLALPGAQLARAANIICDPAERTKVEAAQALAQEVSRGTVTVDQVRQAASSTPLQTPAVPVTLGKPQPAFQPPPRVAPPSPPPQADPRIEATAQVAARTEAEVLSLATEVRRINGNLTGVAQSVATMKTLAEASDRAAATIMAGIKTEIEALRDSGPEIKTEIAAQVRTALAPLLAQATQETAPAIVAATAAPIGRASCQHAFGIDLRDAQGGPVMVDLWDDPEAESIDPAYIWTDSLLRRLILGTECNVWLGGPKGTGKSEALRQFAARTGRKFTRINFRKYSTQEDYVGATGLDGGKTGFQPGPFLRAYVHPGCVILLDEVSNTDPGELAPLNGLLEPRAAVTIGGSVWRRAPGVFIAAADNTLGTGDQSGRYAGTRGMNSALMDRFGLVSRMDYLPRRLETDALVRHTGCSQALAEHVMDAIQVCRAKVDTGEVIDAPSIRSAVAFIRALRLMPVEEAWADTIVARQPVESHPALAAVYTATINTDTIKGAL
jgi:MoxR-like ATPase